MGGKKANRRERGDASQDQVAHQVPWQCPLRTRGNRYFRIRTRAVHARWKAHGMPSITVGSLHTSPGVTRTTALQQRHDPHCRDGEPRAGGISRDPNPCLSVPVKSLGFPPKQLQGGGLYDQTCVRRVTPVAIEMRD